MGVCLWETDTQTPIMTHATYLYDSGYESEFTPETCEMMARVCGITPETLHEFGIAPAMALGWLELFALNHKVEYLVAHKGQEYDIPLLYSELSRNAVTAPVLRTLPVIDTLYDLPFKREPDSRRLKYMALDAGFIPLFEHRALFDVLTMMKVLATFPIKEVLAYRSIPFVVARAMVRREDNQLAREAGFRWERLGNVRFPGCWVSKVRENQFIRLKESCKFEVVRVQ